MRIIVTVLSVAIDPLIGAALNVMSSLVVTCRRLNTNNFYNLLCMFYAVLLKFVADKPGDLSSGELFVLKMNNQMTMKNVTSWDASWISLGKGNQATLDAMAMNPKAKFSDIMEVAESTGSPPVCPEGFLVSNTPSTIITDVSGSKYHMECLKVVTATKCYVKCLNTRHLHCCLATASKKGFSGIDAGQAGHGDGCRFS
jgi:hypothetical protein